MGKFQNWPEVESGILISTLISPVFSRLPTSLGLTSWTCHLEVLPLTFWSWVGRCVPWDGCLSSPAYSVPGHHPSPCARCPLSVGHPAHGSLGLSIVPACPRSGQVTREAASPVGLTHPRPSAHSLPLVFSSSTDQPAPHNVHDGCRRHPVHSPADALPLGWRLLGDQRFRAHH